MKRRSSFLILASTISLLVVTPFRASEDSGAHLLKRALYFADLYNWRAAAPLFKQAEQSFREAGDPRNTMCAHVGTLRTPQGISIGEGSQQLADLLDADPLLLEHTALRLFALTIKGDLDGEIDQSAAREDWREVASLAKELQDKKWMARAQGQLGFADYYDGDLASAQKNVAAALVGAIANNDVGGQIFFLSTIALGYSMEHLLPDVAGSYAKKAIDLAAKSPDAGSPVIANVVSVTSLVDAGKIPEARQLVDQLLEQSRSDHLAERFNYLDAARTVALAEKHVHEAIAYSDEAIRIAESVGEPRAAADMQSTLSQLYLSTGNLPKAEQFATNAITTLENARAVALLPSRLDILAQVLIAQGKYSQASAVYERAAGLQDTLIGRADSMIAKTALITGADQLYEHHFALIAVHFSDTGAAFKVVEQGRGRGMVDLLLAGTSVSPESERIDHSISRLRLEMKSLNDPNEIRRQRDAIFLAEEKRVVNADFTILKSKKSAPVSIEDVQHNLGASEVLLEYVLGEPKSYAVVVTAKTSHVVKLTGRKAIEKMVNDYTVAVRSRQPARQEARQLFDALLAPVTEEGSCSRYVVVPDGVLNLVPFDALVSSDGRYVVESHTVTYAPSATTLYLLRTEPFKGNLPNSLIAVGGVPYAGSGMKRIAIERGYNPNDEFDNLPDSEAEVKAAARALTKSNATLLIGPAATETNVKQQLLRQFGYVHLAVHALSDPDPDRASLVVLADPPNAEDGFIQAAEILRMRLPARLVVLSACETNIGAIEGQAGASTLSTAFLLAGARTVISTLWPVYDKASLELMEGFYEHLGKGQPPADSMTAAKRQVLAKLGANGLPIYWAGFVVQGSQPASSK
jgi:CHAT domain-containing protein/tetratricopeptide (TPR) repeat protein